MRILLAGTSCESGCAYREIDAYLEAGCTVVANTHFWPRREEQAALDRYAGSEGASFERFDPSRPGDLLRVVQEGGIAFDAIVCPPRVDGLTEEVLRAATQDAGLQHRLRAIGCPNDSTSHLAGIADLAAERGVAIVHTPGVHACSVAEYTLAQIGFHARRMAYFYEQTGRDGSWPHEEAASSTHTLQGTFLGVVGGSGKDGAGVIALALKLGMQVISVGSGSRSGDEKMRRLGAAVASDIDELVSRSDYLSINCRISESTFGLIGARQISLMKPGVVVINPAGAEIFDKQALLAEFSQPPEARRIGVLVLDMPFGGRRDSRAFGSDPDNAVLKRRGVLFTPRMAGYTVEGRLQAVTELAAHLDRYLQLGDRSVPIANRGPGTAAGGPPKDDLDNLLDDAIALARQAGAEARRLRAAGLTVRYKADGSPTTNADTAAEMIIRDGLRNLGHAFRFCGEESAETLLGVGFFEVIADGIDGTRNFRDENFGWCVSIAVRADGDTLLGVVHDPQSDETYFARRGRGAFMHADGRIQRCNIPPALPADFSFSVGSFRAAGSSAAKGRIIDAIKRLGGRGREWGCVALSICAVARGGLGAYIQGNSHCYDYIAALLIAREAGADVVERPKDKEGLADVIVSHPSFSGKIEAVFDLTCAA